MTGTKFKKLKPFLFLSPIFTLIIVFKYVPFFMAVEKSFFNWNGANLNEFTGLENYWAVLKDTVFHQSMLNVFIVMLMYIFIAVSIPLLAAELVFSMKSPKIQYYTRTAFTVPMVVPTMVTILLWRWIFASDYGLLNKLLETIGLEQLQTAWLGSSSTALMSTLFVGFPWIGIAMLGGMQFLIYFGGLQGIPRDLFEVSNIDGINVFQRFLFIDLPLISSQMKLMVSLAIISSLQIFDQIFILTNGGPGNATMVPAVYIYQQAFNFSRMGYASSAGVILFVIILLLTYFNQKMLKDTEKID